MSNRVGNYREYKVRDDMERAGWTRVMKAGGSRGVADLLLAHPDHGGALVQVGGADKALTPAERQRFLHIAWLCGHLPIVAIAAPRQPIRYWLVCDAPMSRWERWTP